MDLGDQLQHELNQLASSANLDQAQSGFVGAAQLYGSYYKSLIENGFSAEQAFYLVLNHQQITLMKGS